MRIKIHSLTGLLKAVMAGFVFLCAGAALSPVRAAAIKPESDAERYVLKQVQQGDEAQLEEEFPVDQFKDDKRTLRASFLVELLTNPGLNSKIRRGVAINRAVIDGEFLLGGFQVPYDVVLTECKFNQAVRFIGTQFDKGVNLAGSHFNAEINFDRATIKEGLLAALCTFGAVDLERVKIGGDVSLFGSRFEGDIYATFTNARVGGAFSIDSCHFHSARIFFDEMHVDGDFSARGCSFQYFRPEDEIPTGLTITFAGARFGDFFLNQSWFEEVSKIDFTRMHADSISLEGLEFITPVKTTVRGMSFKSLSPPDPQGIEFLLSQYDAQFYSDVEASARAHGYTSDADQIFLLRRRAERREGCSSFWSNCNHRGRFLWSLFQDGLAGYGKRLQNLLYWSLGFLLLGTIVFWKKEGMQEKDEKATARAHKYQPFWYSLDLFLPIINLGEAEAWKPREDRRWAIFYRRVHIIVGSLFVPIGLAAWTGIIK